jgi:hypothetical protein
MQQFLLALQFQQQQAALQGSQSLSTLFGSAPGGNWSQWPLSQSMQPLPGTQTQLALAQQMQNALGAASATGQFTNPSSFMYPPGTFIRNSDTGAIGQIQQTGGVRTFGSMQEYLAAGGTQQAVNQMPQLSQAEYGNLGTQGQAPQNTMQASQLTGMYQGAPTTQYQQQLANQAATGAQLTGTYYDPSQMTYQPGSFVKDASTGGIGQILPNGQLRMFGSMDEYTAAGGSADKLAGLPSISDAQYYQMATQGQTPGQQTLQSINQAAMLSGMYNGSPTETAREFNQNFGLQQGALTGSYNGAPTEAASEFARNLALQQGQLGQQYLTTASQLQGPQNTFQLSNYLRGAQGNPNVPVYLQNLQNNINTPAFQGTGTTAPTAQSAAGLTSQMGFGVDQNGQPTTGQPGGTPNWGGTSSSATPGWDYNSTLNSINNIAQQGAQKLAPGSLERLSPDEMQAFGSGLGAAGYSLPSFMSQYASSRIGQQAPTARTTLA